MRLATFSPGTGEPRAGVILGDEIADLSACDGGPDSILSLLQRSDWTTAATSLLARAPRYPVETVVWHAPVPTPSLFMAIGLNAPDHRRDVNVGWLLREPRLVRIAAGYLLAHPRPRYPFFFAKAPSSIVGHGAPIVLPKGARQVDWEGELAVIIGTGIHDVGEDEARTAIAGYLIANDVSIRDWQTDNPTATALAKSHPSHGPLGPWLVTADELDLRTAELRTYLNGEQRQRGRISDLLLSPAQVVSRLSRFCALRPGDVVACGTFGGTGWPVGRFLRPGDTVRIEVDGIGSLSNPVSLG
ncbi:fumarylacetoacetate hydrolase family protein [Mycobacterium sp. 48b]|uniref:fumarylacetoacetate hydrolase family protein n=1 Tax=Mycobacterium sp. 48b TaxID=3400426 RepID=UPI003AAB1B96